ncbi:MAG: S9 family peptidase, partial [Balneolaceae bacterium]
MKYLFSLLLPTFILLQCFSSAHSQKQPFDYLDVFDLQFVADPQISPDGNTIVYVRHQFDIMTDRLYTNLWSISFNGDNHQPLTSGKSFYSTPQWSPDGARLAYTSTEEGSNQIFIRWMESGVTTSITNLTRSPGNIQWSPDGSKLLFTMRLPAPSPTIANYPAPPPGAEWAEGAKVIEHVQYRADGTSGFIDEGYTHIFVVSAYGGAPRQLTNGDFNHNTPSWAPEGNSILFTANFSADAELDPTNAQIYELNINTGEQSQLTARRGPHNAPVVSPDGRYIAFTGYENRFVGYQLDLLYLMNRDGTNIRVLSENLDRDISSLQWASDSQSIFFRYDDEG